MIKFENTEVVGWEAAIRGTRNPLNSWSRSDTEYEGLIRIEDAEVVPGVSTHVGIEGKYDIPKIGPNDHALMMKLRNAGTDHRKFMRMIVVYVNISAPLYWWKEFDTYKVGTVANSCSTMHKIADKEFTIEDFSCEHLIKNPDLMSEDSISLSDYEGYKYYSPKDIMKCWIIPSLNACRKQYLQTKDRKYWWQMIQLLPSSYNQRRTVMLNYEVLANIYKSRKAHKLDEWRELCNVWIPTLPNHELITGEVKSNES